MNKHFTRNTLGFLLLVVIAISSGCRQSTVVDSQTPMVNTATLRPSPTSTPEIPTVATTPLPCFSLPSAPTKGIETIAENWFLSEIPQITSRDQYRFVDYLESWNGVCKIYQHAIRLGEDWTKSPTEIALRITTSNTYLEAFTPNRIILVAENDQHLIAKNTNSVPPVANRNIVIVVINYSHYNFHSEDRFDFVRENEIWQIRWWGNRWKCIDSIDSSKWNTDALNCP